VPETFKVAADVFGRRLPRLAGLDARERRGDDARRGD